MPLIPLPTEPCEGYDLGTIVARVTCESETLTDLPLELETHETTISVAVIAVSTIAALLMTVGAIRMVIFCGANRRRIGTLMRQEVARRPDFPVPHLFHHHFPFYVQWYHGEAVIVYPEIQVLWLTHTGRRVNVSSTTGDRNSYRPMIMISVPNNTNHSRRGEGNSSLPRLGASSPSGLH